MHNQANQYRISLHRETTAAMAIVPHDMAFRTTLYHALCSIQSGLPREIEERILREQFETINKQLTATATDIRK